MPRKSAASLAVVRSLTDARPSAPPTLTEAQQEVWRRIVGRMPQDWFPPETWPLLVAMCRHVVLADRVAALIDESRPEWIAVDGGLERLDQLARMQDREHKALSTLATRMRLSQQSRYHQRTAATAAGKRPISGKAPWEARG